MRAHTALNSWIRQNVAHDTIILFVVDKYSLVLVVEQLRRRFVVVYIDPLRRWQVDREGLGVCLCSWLTSLLFSFVMFWYVLVNVVIGRRDADVEAWKSKTESFRFIKNQEKKVSIHKNIPKLRFSNASWCPRKFFGRNTSGNPGRQTKTNWTEGRAIYSRDLSPRESKQSLLPSFIRYQHTSYQSFWINT